MTGLREGMKVRLWDELQERCIDSALVSSGTFRFDLELDTETLASIRGRGINRQFILEEGEIVLEGSASDDFLKGASGTELNARFARFLSYYSMLYDSEKPAYVRRVVKYNRDNLLSVAVLRFASCISSYEAVKLIESVDKPILELAYTRRYLEYRQRLMRVEPSRPGSKSKPYYHDFALSDINGRGITLSGLVNDPSSRYVLIDFWASWCRPCVSEIPYLSEAYERYGGRGLQILCVSWDKDEDKWRRFVQEHGMIWANAVDPAGAASQISLDYVVEALPVNVLIDCSTGLVIGRNLRGEDLLNALRSLRFGKPVSL